MALVATIDLYFCGIDAVWLGIITAWRTRSIRSIIEWLVDLDGADESGGGGDGHHVDSIWHIMVWGVVGDYRAHVVFTALS
jgi:hypothetical protein